MTFDYVQGAEGAINLIIPYIQSNIGSALNSVAANVGNPKIALSNPKEYYIYEKPQGYQLPAVFVICDEFDFRVQEMKSNFVNAKAKIKVSILVEDQDANNLTYSAWRYQSALISLLNNAQILSASGNLKLIVVVYRARFSPTYMRAESKSGEGGAFRKEIVLDCEVEHYENF